MAPKGSMLLSERAFVGIGRSEALSPSLLAIPANAILTARNPSKRFLLLLAISASSRRRKPANGIRTMHGSDKTHAHGCRFRQKCRVQGALSGRGRGSSRNSQWLSILRRSFPARQTVPALQSRLCHLSAVAVALSLLEKLFIPQVQLVAKHCCRLRSAADGGIDGGGGCCGHLHSTYCQRFHRCSRHLVCGCCRLCHALRDANS